MFLPMATSHKPFVAIVGRQNVGKSTLFNRLVGTPAAVVSEIAGTTRDRIATETVWADYPFILVDTGGIDPTSQTEFSDEVTSQVKVAIAEADVIVMLVDVTAGVTPDDLDVADILRRGDKPVVLAASKADNEARETEAPVFYELGLGEPVPVSAYHNIGVDDLMARVIAHFPSEPVAPETDADLRLAIVGRTNVGKSLLLNSITGQERAIVSDVPGTTRDAIDTLISTDKGSVLLVDTAGIRRRGKVAPGIERYSVMRSIRAIDRCDVVLLVMDATGLATSQDAHVASYIVDAAKGIILVVNKWDLIGDNGLTQDEATAILKERLKFVSHAPVRFVSALTGSGIDKLADVARAVFVEWNKGLPRYDLSRTIMNAIAKHPPATIGRRAVKIYSVAQDRTGPPSFTFYVNRSSMVHFGYRRYLENTLRNTYGFAGSPLKMRFKGRGEP